MIMSGARSPTPWVLPIGLGAGAAGKMMFGQLGLHSDPVSQDVPKYMMVSGERAELRGLNLEGLKRCGFSDTEIRSLRTAYRKIFMSTDANSGGIENRLAEVEKHEELAYVPAVCLMVQSIRDSFSEDRRGICKSRSLSVGVYVLVSDYYSLQRTEQPLICRANCRAVYEINQAAFACMY
ncbi:unnamed protein product [Camellia sinensis]